MCVCACTRVCVCPSSEDLQDKRQPHLFHCHRVFNTDQINMTFGMSGQARIINPDIRAVSTSVRARARACVCMYTFLSNIEKYLLPVV